MLVTLNVLFTLVFVLEITWIGFMAVQKKRIIAQERESAMRVKDLVNEAMTLVGVMRTNAEMIKEQNKSIH